MNHTTTLRIMERLQADELCFEVSSCGNLPLGGHSGQGLRSMLWKRRVHRRSSLMSRSQVHRPASAGE
jgi:hypothetical protein